MQQRHDNLRKAAILVASLDRLSADKMLNEMSPEQAARLRRALVELGPVDPEEQGEVIEEFFRIGPLVPRRFPAGIELGGRVAQEMQFADLGGSVATPRESVEPGAEPFRCLRNVSGAELSQYLEREHPQTIALVVSHLPAERAAETLACLGPRLQAEVARRLVDLEAAEPEVIREVERGLESWLAEKLRGDERRRVGMTALQGILAAADDRTQQEILTNLGAVDQRLAGKLKPPARRAPDFADLERWEDAALIALVERADPEVVILALAGARHEFVERVLVALPGQRARVWRQALDHLGPTPLSDLETAQRRLAAFAESLEASGKLGATTPRRFSLAV
jgi:flagellar motor switch protein FliG